MTRYVFTGPTRLPLRALPVVDRTLRARKDGYEFTTGAAPGLDVYAMRTLVLAFPEALHRIVVPAAPHDEEAVEFAYKLGVVVEYAAPPPETTPSRKRNAVAYRLRNEHMVHQHADILTAFVLGSERSYPRAGEWMTIRIARAAHVPTIFCDLSPYRKDS